MNFSIMRSVADHLGHGVIVLLPLDAQGDVRAMSSWTPILWWDL